MGYKIQYGYEKECKCYICGYKTGLLSVKIRASYCLTWHKMYALQNLTVNTCIQVVCCSLLHCFSYCSAKTCLIGLQLYYLI